MPAAGSTGVIAVAALIVAMAVAWALPTMLLYPEQCTFASNVGAFCIEYDPSLGRYEAPPPAVPADFARSVTDNAHPNNFRIAYGALAFALAFGGIWTVMRSRERRRSR